jgi:hypothetical protein
LFDIDAELFVQFARKRRDSRLAGLDFAAGKFPVTGIDLYPEDVAPAGTLRHDAG